MESSELMNKSKEYLQKRDNQRCISPVDLPFVESNQVNPVTKSNFSPLAVAFVPRDTLTQPVSVTSGEGLTDDYHETILSPPSSPTSIATCSLSPSQQVAAKTAQWAAWKKKRKRAQYTLHSCVTNFSLPSRSLCTCSYVTAAPTGAWWKEEVQITPPFHWSCLYFL